MSDQPVLPTGRMTRAEFYAWAEAQPRGRFELFEGQVMAMAPERIAHTEAKAAVWLALRNAIAKAAAPCRAYMDGAAVEIGSDTSYEPDAVVNCGERPDPDAKAVPSPVIVVEVTSPSTGRVDTVQKLADYFRVPSIQHYLIIDVARRMVVHHRRQDNDTLSTRIAAAGPIVFDPPGITIAAEALFED